MLITNPCRGVYHFHAKSRYELISTLIRVQEFYESDIPTIRGNVFTFEEFVDAYAAQQGNFTYFTDWNGFNLPGDAIRTFCEVFKGQLRKREEAFLTELRYRLDGQEWQTSDYTVIGTWRDDDIDHEYAHAFWQTSPEYRMAMEELMLALDPDWAREFAGALKSKGYVEDVLADEIQAYVATSDSNYLHTRYGVVLPEGAERFRATLEEFKHRLTGSS